MAHITEIVEIREVNEEQVSYRIVCCGLRCPLHGGDPSLGCTPDSHKCHDSWCTVNVNVPDHAVIDQAIADHSKRTSDKHERKQQWQKKEQARMSALASGHAVALTTTDVSA